MRTRSLSFAAAVSMLAAGSVFAQTAQAPSTAPFELPDACRSLGGAMPASSSMMQNMHGMMGGMNDAQKGYMDAMMRMNLAMMRGMMAKDPDLAFACSMMAHHMGAIEMAKVVMKFGDDAEAKRIAGETVKEQEQGDLRAQGVGSETREEVAAHAPSPLVVVDVPRRT